MEEWLEDISTGYSDAVRESVGDTSQVSQTDSRAGQGLLDESSLGWNVLEDVVGWFGAHQEIFSVLLLLPFFAFAMKWLPPCGGYALQLCGVFLRGGVYVLSAVYSAAGTAPDGFCVERQFVGLGFGDIFRSVGLDIQAVFRDLGAPFVLADFVAGGDPVRESGRFCVARIDGGSADGAVDYGGCLEVKTAPRDSRGAEKEELR